MAKISERLVSTNMLREKRRDTLDPQRVNLFGEDSICMVNLLETPGVIVFFICDMIDLLRLFQKRSFVLSNEDENQNVATIGTLLDQFMFKSQCRNISRISNQFPKIKFWFIPPKQPFGMVISKNDINKSPSALHWENFRKVRKFTKNTIFIHEISQNFERFQRNSTGAKKLLLTSYSSHV